MQDPGRFEMHGQRWVPQTKDFILAASVQWGIPGDRAHPHSDPCLSKSPEAPPPEAGPRLQRWRPPGTGPPLGATAPRTAAPLPRVLRKPPHWFALQQVSLGSFVF